MRILTSLGTLAGVPALLLLSVVAGCASEPFARPNHGDEPDPYYFRILGTRFMQSQADSQFSVLEVGTRVTNWSDLAVNATVDGFRVAINKPASQESPRIPTTSLLNLGGVLAAPLEPGEFVSFCAEHGNEMRGYVSLVEVKEERGSGTHWHSTILRVPPAC